MLSSKNISKILSLVLVIFLGGILVAHAVGYVPLAPLPIGEGGTTPKEYADMGTYLAGMLKFMIAIGGVIAIVMAIYGGIARIASGISPSAKADADKRITDALVGLALVLTSYLILNSINPNLVKLDLNLPKLAGSRRAVSTSTVTVAGERTPWGDDSSFRNGKLTKLDSFIAVNRENNCTYVGEYGCTSLTGLSTTVINGLKGLRSACNCPMVITGGTEYWLHGNKALDMAKNPTGHKPGGSVVDLSKDTSVTAYIEHTGQVFISGCSNGKKYKIGNDIYVDENLGNNDPHWHVCFGGGGGNEDMSNPYTNPSFGETAGNVAGYQ